MHANINTRRRSRRQPELMSSMGPSNPTIGKATPNVPPVRDPEKGCITATAAATVDTVTVTGVDTEPLSAMALGEIVHVDCAGAPLHVKDTI